MWSPRVVESDPRRKPRSALGGRIVGADIGPFAQAGLDEALGLAAGARRIGFGSQMAQADVGAGSPEPWPL